MRLLAAHVENECRRQNPLLDEVDADLIVAAHVKAVDELLDHIHRLPQSDTLLVDLAHWLRFLAFTHRARDVGRIRLGLFHHRGNKDPYGKDDDCADDRADEAGRFIPPVPTESLSEIGRHKGPDDPEDRRENKARGLIRFAWIKELRDKSRDEADYNSPDDMHGLCSWTELSRRPIGKNLRYNNRNHGFCDDLYQRVEWQWCNNFFSYPVRSPALSRNVRQRHASRPCALVAETFGFPIHMLSCRFTRARSVSGREADVIKTPCRLAGRPKIPRRRGRRSRD